MKNKLFALTGKYDSGKTSTIKLVYNILQEKFNLQKIDDKNDIKVIIEINGVKIGIESEGDPQSEGGGRLKDSLKEFVSSNCQIIICSRDLN